MSDGVTATSDWGVNMDDEGALVATLTVRVTPHRAPDGLYDLEHRLIQSMSAASDVALTYLMPYILAHRYTPPATP